MKNSSPVVYSLTPVLFVLLIPLPASGLAADRILLRDLTLLDDVTIESFDTVGVRLGDGTIIGWDRIERARIDDARQAAFDQQLGELGEPLFRIRRRLINGDHDELLDIAKDMEDLFAGERGESALLVSLAVMRGHLHQGNRPAALPAYFDLLNSARVLDDEELARLNLEFNGLSINRQTGLCSQFMPIWFDAEGARQVLAKVEASIASMPEPVPPGCYVYASTLASAAGQTEKGSQWLARIETGNIEIDELKQIAQLQQAVARNDAVSVAEFERKVDNLLPRNRAVALYWLGIAKYSEDEARRRHEAILTWLRLPAEYGQYSELAAAGLYYAQRGLGEMNDAAGQDTLTRELLSRYPDSFFAGRIRAALPAGDKR